MKYLPWPLGMCITVILIILFAQLASIIEERNQACQGAIAAIGDRRQLGLYITANPSCAQFLKVENWAPQANEKIR